MRNLSIIHKNVTALFLALLIVNFAIDFPDSLEEEIAVRLAYRPQSAFAHILNFLVHLENDFGEHDYSDPLLKHTVDQTGFIFSVPYMEHGVSLPICGVEDHRSPYHAPPYSVYRGVILQPPKSS